MSTDPEQGAQRTDLDADRIVQFGAPSRLRPRIEGEVDSTNLELARLRAAGESVQVLIAEAQTAGRGRRGRVWLSPPGCGLYLSMFRSFALAPRRLGALGLVAGLATSSAVAKSCPPIRPGVKWPNDVLVNGRKLAGCLIDLTGTRETSSAIIGVGINVNFQSMEGPDQPWTDLARISALPPDRDQLAAALITQLDEDLSRFADEGFAPFAALWKSHDVLLGRDVLASAGSGQELSGRAMGVDVQGQLLIQNDHGLHHLPAGDVTLRPLR